MVGGIVRVVRFIQSDYFPSVETGRQPGARFFWAKNSEKPRKTEAVFIKANHAKRPFLHDEAGFFGASHR